MKQIQDAPKTLPCPYCWGKGVLTFGNPDGSISHRGLCSKCRGTGKIPYPEIKHGPDYEEVTE